MSNGKVELIFFRHGLADWPNWNGDDDDRPLTEAGKNETREVSAFLASLRLKPGKIITSPLPRASQTAEIVAKYLHAPLEVSDCLAKGFGAKELKKLLHDDKIDSVMLVGHEPDFSAVIEEITGGDVKLNKSGVARVRLDPVKMSGRLLWLLTPDICRTTPVS